MDDLSIQQMVRTNVVFGTCLQQIESSRVEIDWDPQIKRKQAEAIYSNQLKKQIK